MLCRPENLNALKTILYDISWVVTNYTIFINKLKILLKLNNLFKNSGEAFQDKWTRRQHHTSSDLHES